MQLSKLAPFCSKAIVDDNRKKKRAFKRPENAFTAKRGRTAGDKRSGVSVFTDADFAAVGEFLKTELIKKKSDDVGEM